MSISKKHIALWGIALFVMFLPRKLELAGMFSFRLFIMLFAVVVFVLLHKPIRVSGLVKRPTYLLYLLILCVRYLASSEIVSLIGYLTDILILYLLLNTLIESKLDIDYFICAFLKVLSVYALGCIIETLTGINLWSFFGVDVARYKRYGLYRCYGAFTTSINNGVFLVMTFPLIWYMNRFSNRQRLVKTCNMLVWIALLCTISRAPILGAFLLHMMVVWRVGLLKFFKKNILKILMALIITAFAIVFVPSVARIFTSFTNMFLAIVDPAIAASITDSFGKNTVGVGQRTDLYTWIWKSVRDNKWFGMGPNAKFAYDWQVHYGYIATKTSIENFYLATLYRLGIVGLSSLIIFFAGEIFAFLKKIRKARKIDAGMRLMQFEILATVLVYFLVLFTVSAMDEYKMFFLLILLSDKLNALTDFKKLGLVNDANTEKSI